MSKQALLSRPLTAGEYKKQTNPTSMEKALLFVNMSIKIKTTKDNVPDARLWPNYPHFLCHKYFSRDGEGSMHAPFRAEGAFVCSVTRALLVLPWETA